MHVLLINPTSFFEVMGSNPAALEKSRGHNPPLGILLLASYLEKHSDHHVTILDTQAEELGFEQIAERIADARPDVVGITTMTQTLLDVMRIIEVVKVRAPEATVVLGGPHVHLFPRESIELPGVDVLVLGEGEKVFCQLLQHLDDEEQLGRIPGLVFRSGDDIVHTGPPSLIRDLDELPFPARHLTDIHRYSSVLAPRSPATTMFTSRGCPYVCTFCDRPHLGKRFRARSAENVVDEMQHCVSMGIHEFLIYDDTFTVKRSRVERICNEILARGLDVGFDVRTRVDTVNPGMLQLMARAGCRAIHYGVEAGTEKILTVLKKKIDLDTVQRIFSETRKAGIQILAYFIIGSPTETRDDILETFRLARKLDPDFLHLTILTPFPGTEIYREGLESEVIPSDVWREFATHPHMGFVPPYWPENFSLEELNQLLVEGYRGFYRRPHYLMRRVLAVRSVSDFTRKAIAGMRILTMRGKLDGMTRHH